jgi:chromosome segregation ATPase
VDRDTYLKSLEGLPEEKKNELISVFDENEKLRNIKNEAFQDRDEVKKKNRELQEKLDAIEKEKQEAERKRLEEQNEFKTLYEKSESEKADLKKINEELNGKLSPLEQQAKEAEEKAAKVEAERRKELLDRLEDEDLKKIAEKIPANEDLRAFVETSLEKLNKRIGADGGRTGKFRKETISGKKWKDLTMQEKSDLKKNDPELYNKLYNERNNRS